MLNITPWSDICTTSLVSTGIEMSEQLYINMCNKCMFAHMFTYSCLQLDQGTYSEELYG